MGIDLKQATELPSSFQTVKGNGSGSYFDPIEIELMMVGLNFNDCLWF